MLTGRAICKSTRLVSFFRLAQCADLPGLVNRRRGSPGPVPGRIRRSRCWPSARTRNAGTSGSRSQHQQLERHLVLTQPPYQIDSLVEADVAVVIAVDQKDGSRPDPPHPRSGIRAPGAGMKLRMLLVQKIPPRRACAIFWCFRFRILS